MSLKKDTRSKISSGLFSNRSVEWGTPLLLFKNLNKDFKFDLDVAANASNAKCRKFYSKRENGLLQSWSGDSKNKSIFCNPPFGKGIENWLEKVIQERANGCTIVVIVPFRPDTNWFHHWVMNQASEVRLIKGRLKYNDGKTTSPFPSAILVYRPGKLRTRFSIVDKTGNKLK